jgi:hypothetical protein
MKIHHPNPDGILWLWRPTFEIDFVCENIAIVKIEKFFVIVSTPMVLRAPSNRSYRWQILDGSIRAATAEGCSGQGGEGTKTKGAAIHGNDPYWRDKMWQGLR